MEVEPLLRLLVAAGLTALIGLDRELRAKPAGLRTNIVVGVAAAAFAWTGAEAFQFGDPTRVAAQIVSGVGFLGGGAIFAAGGKPHGLTTAAALWGSSAVGLSAGVGEFGVAASVVLVTLVALWPLDFLATQILARFGRHDARVDVVCDDLAVFRAVRDELRTRSLELHDLDLRHVGGRYIAELTVYGRSADVVAAVNHLHAREDCVVFTDEALRAPDA